MQKYDEKNTFISCACLFCLSFDCLLMYCASTVYCTYRIYNTRTYTPGVKVHYDFTVEWSNAEWTKSMANAFICYRHHDHHHRLVAFLLFLLLLLLVAIRTHTHTVTHLSCIIVSSTDERARFKSKITAKTGWPSKHERRFRNMRRNWPRNAKEHVYNMEAADGNYLSKTKTTQIQK